MKKVLILLGIAAVLVVGYGALYFFYLTRLASPQETVSLNDGELSISVTYCRPSKNGRLIFGEESEGALQPWGKYWRLGANQATEIEFNKPVSFAGQRIEAGRYRLYAIPGKQTWEIVFNSELGEWGYDPADRELDVLSLKIAQESMNELVEMFTITILSSDDLNKYTLNLFWDQTLIRIPFSYE